MSVIDYILTRGPQLCPALGPLLALGGPAVDYGVVTLVIGYEIR